MERIDHVSCIQMKMIKLFICCCCSFIFFFLVIRLYFTNALKYVKICLIGQTFKDVHHSYDVFHNARNLGKKINKIFTNCLTVNS